MDTTEMSEVSNVTLYDESNNIVLVNGAGYYKVERTDTAYNTSLVMSEFTVNSLQMGGTYYAIGTMADNQMFQSEKVQLVSNTLEFILTGSISINPNATPPSRPPRAADTSDIEIIIANRSGVTFSLYQQSDLQYVLGGLTQSPGPTLPSMQTAFMGASQLLSSLDEGPADIILIAYTPGNTQGIGIWIHFNFQFMGMGDRPNWKIYDGSWKPSGTDPSTPYTFDTSIGFKATATPTSGHSSLTVNLLIEKLNS